MRRLKIAFLSRWYWEENRRACTVEGGPVQQLAEAVADLGHDVTVLSQSPRAERLDPYQIGALEVWLSPREKRGDFFTGLRDKWAKFLYLHRKVHSDAADLAEFLQRRGPFDVLWANCEEPDGLVAAVAAENGVALPPVLTEIYALRYRFAAGQPHFTEKPALRLAFRHAARLVAHSDLVAEALSAYAGPRLTPEALAAKTRVITHNLQLEFLRAAAEPTDAVEAEPNRVLFLGALNEKKGALVFLDALGRTAAAKSGAVFAMAGDFTEENLRFRREWETALAAVRTDLAPAQLELLGKVSPAGIIREIRRASVVVFPSLFDEFSRALVEALVLGRPVVTTKGVGAWPLVAEHVCGEVVEPANSSALAEAIDALLHPQAHYAANARQLSHRLLHEVSPEAVARRLVHQFEEMTWI
jgi:glycosyltransferase involved in cell wall biosynthesis